MTHPLTRDRVGQALRSTAFMLLTALATLAALELVLRVADLRVLREGTVSAR